MNHLKEEFPFFSVHPDFVYLDTAATSQKPRCVIDRITEFYTSGNTNVHRGMYHLSIQATEAYEGARDVVKDFLGAESREEIIFTSGATDGLNLLAQILSRGYLKEGEGILVSAMEHHSNLIPWQEAVKQYACTLHFIDHDDQGRLKWREAFDDLPSSVKIVSITMMNHVFGSETPYSEIIAEAHSRGLLVILDAAQAAPRRILNMTDLDCDFLVLSGHKIYGPTGIGVLYGKKALLESLPVWKGGGDMISSVWLEKARYNDLPWRYEAGTPPIAQAIGLGEALRWLQGLDRSALIAGEEALTAQIRRGLASVPGIEFYGEEDNGIISFNLGMVHSHDLGQFLDSRNIGVRTGHHCAHPVMRKLGIPSTVRASLGLYSDEQDVACFISAMNEAREYFNRYGL